MIIPSSLPSGEKMECITPSPFSIGVSDNEGDDDNGDEFGENCTEGDLRLRVVEGVGGEGVEEGVEVLRG